MVKLNGKYILLLQCVYNILESLVTNYFALSAYSQLKHGYHQLKYEFQIWQEDLIKDITIVESNQCPEDFKNIFDGAFMFQSGKVFDSVLDYQNQNRSICVQKIDGLTYFNLMKLKQRQSDNESSEIKTMVNIIDKSNKNPINQIKIATDYLLGNQEWELKGKYFDQYVYIHRFNYYEDTKLPIAMFSYGVQNLFDQSTGPKLFKLQKLRQKIEVLDVVQLNKLDRDQDYNVWYEQNQANKKLVNHELFWFGSVHYDEWKSSPSCINLMDKISDQYKLKSFLKARNILWVLSAISSLIIGIIFPVVSIYVEIFANIETKTVKSIQKYNLWATAIFGAILVPLAATSAFNAYMKKDYFKELASLQCSTVLNNQAFANVARIIAKSFKDNIISIVFILIGQLINIYLFKKRKQQLKKMLNISVQKLIAQSLENEQKKDDKKEGGGFMANLIENEEEKLEDKNQ